MARKFDFDSLLLSDGPLAIRDDLLRRVLLPFESTVPRLAEAMAERELNRHRIGACLVAVGAGLSSTLVERLALISDLVAADEPLLLRTRLKFLDITIEDPCSIGDLAAILVLEAKKVAEELVVILQPARRRKYECYYANAVSIPQASELPPDLVEAIQEKIAKRALSEGRTRVVKVLQPMVRRGFKLVVSRGDVLHRTPAVDPTTNDRTTLTFYPEMTDVIVYDPSNGSLLVRAEHKSDVRTYLSTIGELVFGDDRIFERDGRARYFTAEPLVRNMSSAFFCRDVPGIARVIATRISWTVPGYDHDPYEYVASLGLGADGRDLHTVMHKHATPRGIDITIELEDRRRRQIMIQLPNTVVLYDDDEAELALKWLRQRGFILSMREALSGNTMRLMDGA